jgi:hypothetical protein
MVVLCLVLYYCAYWIVLIQFNLPKIIVIITLVVSIIITIILIMVLIDRIREIRSGETDDLGKY